MRALRAWARREPILAIRLAGALVALAGWLANKYLGVTLDTDELMVLAGLALLGDTYVTREAVYAPSTVDRLQAEAHAAGERRGAVEMTTYTERS
jgi:hypothetical protein